tara:strand:- start:3715 stop:4155 length:441 start_codon:yes stop_codon:yes gene_type:complete
MNERAYNTNEILELTIENGGGTWLRLGRGGFCNPFQYDRYVLAGYEGDGLVIPNFKSQPVDFVTHLIEWFALQINRGGQIFTENGFCNPVHNAHFGTWVRGDDLVLDIVELEDDFVTAMEEARERNQDAIFDLVEMKEVFVTEVIE